MSLTEPFSDLSLVKPPPPTAAHQPDALDPIPKVVLPENGKFFDVYVNLVASPSNFTVSDDGTNMLM